jgi:uncharacterized protein
VHEVSYVERPSSGKPQSPLAGRPGEAAENELCQACGLCCQGHLYEEVELHPLEVPVASNWPVKLVVKGAITSFKQPCACFQNMQCTVYAQRPATCRGYSCKLLDQFRNGEVSLSEAHELVGQARGLVDVIEARLPETSHERIWKRISEKWRAEGRQPGLGTGELDPEALLDIVALDVLLNRYFHHPATAEATGVGDNAATSA